MPADNQGSQKFPHNFARSCERVPLQLHVVASGIWPYHAVGLGS